MNSIPTGIPSVVNPAGTVIEAAYTRNVFNNRECKITHFHQVVQDMLDADN